MGSSNINNDPFQRTFNRRVDHCKCFFFVPLVYLEPFPPLCEHWRKDCFELTEENMQEFGPSAGVALIPPNSGCSSHSTLSKQQQFPLVTALQILLPRNSIFSAAAFPNCESLAAFISPSNVFCCNLQFGDLAMFLVCFQAWAQHLQIVSWEKVTSSV